jgi:hypothetical protein
MCFFHVSIVTVAYVLLLSKAKLKLDMYNWGLLILWSLSHS